MEKLTVREASCRTVCSHFVCACMCVLRRLYIDTCYALVFVKQYVIRFTAVF